ncbi:MAG: DNA mismatch repair endonuclease MutL [Alistipes sp.]|nr:DNA mismatch repair endonuclease MutL [Alistipes sp.]
MSDKIKLLPEIVANQIAAGEVVNTPSNVVKEMMENSIDAGARSIRVNFRDGGKQLIQIIDDGEGMSPLDARMAFDRHATSKISSFDDIYSLHTFGFRGEALASIAAVAEVELRTRQAGDEVGTQTIIRGGEFQSQTPVMCPVGAQFAVRNIFYNVPSRRKFIDGDNARLVSQMKQEFTRVALCNPEVEFELMSNDAPLYRLPASNLAGRIVDLIGKHIKHNLLDVSVETSVVSLSGFVGRPAAAKKRNSEQYLFVNGRYFQSPQLQKAICKAYEKLIPEGCTPSYFIYMTVDADRVDVNVHPQKTTVKFADGEVIAQIVQAAVRETLAKTGAIPMMDFSTEGRVDIPVMRRDAVYREPRSMSNSSYNPFREEYIDVSAPMPDEAFTGFDVPYDGEMPQSVHEPSPREMMNVAAEQSDEEFVSISSAMTSPVSSSAIEYVDEELSEGVEQELEYISSPESGTVGSGEPGLFAAASFEEVCSWRNGYASALYGGRAVVIDLRRVRERIVYENTLAVLSYGSAPSQRLLFAERLTLGAEEYEAMELHATEFAALGFEVEFAGDGVIEVGGVPAVAGQGMAVDELIYDLLQGIDDGQMPVQMQRRRMAEVMARRAAASYGKGISSAEAQSLMSQLESCLDRSFSPSGRPLMAELTVEEIRAKLS